MTNPHLAEPYLLSYPYKTLEEIRAEEEQRRIGEVRRKYEETRPNLRVLIKRWLKYRFSATKPHTEFIHDPDTGGIRLRKTWE